MTGDRMLSVPEKMVEHSTSHSRGAPCLAIVACRRTRTFASQARLLAADIGESTDNQVTVHERIIAGNDTRPILNALRQPADVLVLLGHTVLDDNQAVSTVLGIPVADLRSALNAHVVVLNTCFLGWDHCLPAAHSFVAAPTAAVVCAGTAPYTHGPILLPTLLTALLTDTRSPDWHSKLRHAMYVTQERLATKHPRMNRERWTVTTLGE